MRTVLLIKLVLFIALTFLVLENFGYAEVKDGKLNVDFKGTADSFNDVFKEVEEKSSQSFQNVSDKISGEVPDYQVQLKGVRNLNDCVEKGFDVKVPCLLIDIEIINLEEESISFDITRKAIITKDGKQYDRYGGFFETKDLNKLCDTFTSVRVFPNANKNMAMCFPTVSKNDKPVLYVGISTVGEQNEYKLDLASYLP